MYALDLPARRRREPASLELLYIGNSLDSNARYRPIIRRQHAHRGPTYLFYAATGIAGRMLFFPIYSILSTVCMYSPQARSDQHWQLLGQRGTGQGNEYVAVGEARRFFLFLFIFLS